MSKQSKQENQVIIENSVDNGVKINAVIDGAEEENPKPKGKGFFVSKGRAISCMVGILSAGEEVKEEYFSDSNCIPSLVKSGVVVENK